MPSRALLPALLLTATLAAASNDTTEELDDRCFGIRPITPSPEDEGEPLLVEDSCGEGRWLVIQRATGHGSKDSNPSPTGPPCGNEHPHCHPWSQRGECQGRHATWMLKHCRSSCGVCVEPAGPCRDNNYHCLAWSRRGECGGRHATWMYQNCKRSCGVCMETTEISETETTESVACVPYCPEFTTNLNGRCVEIEDLSSCPSGMEWATNHYGEAECECQEGKVFHESSGQCWDPYLEDGPCEHGESLQMVSSPEDGGRFACAPSLCEGDAVAMTTSCGQVHPWSVGQNPDYSCFDYSPENLQTGPCQGSAELQLNEDLEVSCATTLELVFFLLNVEGKVECPPNEKFVGGQCLPTRRRRLRQGRRTDRRRGRSQFPRRG